MFQAVIFAKLTSGLRNRLGETLEERTLTAREVEWLLDKLCVDCGFCLAPPERLKLQREPPADPVSFTNAVFRGEGLDPTLAERDLYRDVHALITRAFKQRGIAVEETPPKPGTPKIDG